MNKRKIDASIKKDFPFLQNNKETIFLNSSSSSLKLGIVINKMLEMYSKNESLVFRTTSMNTKDNLEILSETFNVVSNHINAPIEDVILTYGTTYSINRIAFKLINSLNDGDEIILGKMEHSANILTWKKIAKELNKKIVFKWYNLKNWEIDYLNLKELITDKTKIIAVAHVFNTVGTKNDLKKIREIIGNKVKLFVDGAQAIGHIPINVQEADVDYYVFGAHKCFGSFGIGFAYIKNLQSIEEPFQYGGGTDQNYSEDEVIYKTNKFKFLAGTIDLPGAYAFKYAIEYIESFGMEQIEEYNNSLKAYAEKKIGSLKKVNIINKNVKSSNLFFEIKGVSGEDVGYHLSKDNILLRTGSSCVKITYGDYQPYKAIRASFHIYNNKEDIDKLYESLKNGGDFLEALFNKRSPSEICK
ncbi:MAG: cysteine desulfurase [Candidatus Tyloplasma litorale]|nr:MAG: cysteine desulfurase [Mycoplasmatales bacterium]